MEVLNGCRRRVHTRRNTNVVVLNMKLLKVISGKMDIAVYVDMAVNIQVERQPVQKKQFVLFVSFLMEK